MLSNHSIGRRIRLGRLDRHDDRRLLVVPLDHSVSDGPIAGSSRFDQLVGQFAGAGVDAVVLHKGRLRHVDHRSFATMSLIVHLSASTVHAADADAKYLVSSVEEALRLGADAVSVHVNLGSDHEARQVGDLAAVSDACDRWNIPLLAMMYFRGPRIGDPRDPALVAHAVTLAADLGADLVKTVYAGSVADMADVTRGCPIPVIAAGGPRLETTAEVLRYVADVLRGGAAGVAMGRNVFQAKNPAAMAAQVAALVHPEAVLSLQSPRPQPDRQLAGTAG
jgi:2-amino-4,5-dihydroxy-6-oxo-7-(phosphonooxy)heptanoate synthase